MSGLLHRALGLLAVDAPPAGLDDVAFLQMPTAEVHPVQQHFLVGGVYDFGPGGVQKALRVSGQCQAQQERQQRQSTSSGAGVVEGGEEAEKIAAAHRKQEVGTRKAFCRERPPGQGGQM